MEKGHNFDPSMDAKALPVLPEGVALELKEGKTYKTLELPEDVLAVNMTEAGKVFNMPRGAFIEVNEKGEPKNAFVREWMKSENFRGKLD